LPVIIFGDHTRHVKFIDFPFAIGADGTQLLQPKPFLEDKFFYYNILQASNLIGNYGYDRHLKHLKEFVIKYPQSITEQRKIAKILTTVDNLIEKTETLIAKYQSIKQGMMHELFTRGVDANGQLRPPVDESPELYKESELGWIPKGWEIVSIEDVATQVTDGDHQTPVRSNSGILLLSARNILNGKFF